MSPNELIRTLIAEGRKFHQKAIRRFKHNVRFLRDVSFPSKSTLTSLSEMIAKLSLTSTMGANNIYLRHRPDDKCRLLATVIPAFVVYALFSLDGFRNRDCNPSPHSLAPLLGTLSPPSMTTLTKSNSKRVLSGSKNHAQSDDSVANSPVPTLPLCAADGSRARTFLMIFMGHSGSSAIISELAGHSQVYFEEGEPVDHFEYETNTTLALEWTRNFFQRGIRAGKTPGFKLRPTHIFKDPAAWAALAREFETRIIWQYRENLFKKTVGEYTNRYLNDTSVVEGLRREMTRAERCRIGAGCRFRVDDLRFFDYLLRDSVRSDAEIASAVHMIVAGRDCVHPLPYEDYLYDRTGTMLRLQTFLGLKHEMHLPKRFKATSDNLCDAVENWDDLCANFYACHAWRWQMQDVKNNCFCNFSSGTTQYCNVDLP